MKRASLPWTVKTFVGMIKKGTANFDLAIQRNYVWGTDKEKCSLLIDSVLRDYPIPALLTVREEGEKGNIYHVIDGKQRGLTFASFLNDEFELTGLEEFETEEGEIIDLNGKKFSDLPEELQDIINSYSLTAYYLMDALEEQIESIFVRQQNGMPLTKFEITRVLASKLMPTIQKITEHEAFSHFAVSEKQLLRYVDQEIALQMLITVFDESPSFVGEYMQQWAENFTITAEQEQKMMDILDVFSFIYEKAHSKACKKAFKKTHIASLTYLINKYGKDDSMNYVFFINEFFEGKRVKSDRYADASKGGTAKPDKVQTRFREADKYFTNMKEETNQVAATN